MKRIGKKGFTLIELLAVIVVLAIILVITVPMILNSISTTRQESLQASADTAAKYYTNQLGMAFLGVKQNGFVVDATLSSNGKLNPQSYRSISKEEADILGLNTEDYSINESCTGTVSLPETCYSNTLDYSKVKWDEDGNATVRLVGKDGGKFVSGSNVLVATSNESTTTSTNFDSSENITLSNTTAGKTIKNLKIYGNTENSFSVGNAANNLFNCYLITAGDYKLNSYLSNSNGTTVNSNTYSGQIEVTQTKYPDSSNVSNYTNGYFTIGLNGLENGKTYTMLYDFEILSNPLNINKQYLLINGKNTQYNPKILGNTAKVTFTWDGTANPAIEFRIAGRSMIYKNFVIVDNETNYQIPITVSGKNLFKFDSNKTKAYKNSDFEILNNGIKATGILDSSSPNSWKSGYVTYYSSAPIKKGTYTVSWKHEVSSSVSIPSNLNINIYGYNSVNTRVFETNIRGSYNSETKRFTYKISPGMDLAYMHIEIPLFGTTSVITDAQIEKGNISSPYEPYVVPITHTITLSAPLRSNGSTRDYIDFELGKVIRWIASDGSILSNPKEENITLPDIKTISGTTILSSDTIVKPLISGSY